MRWFLLSVMMLTGLLTGCRDRRPAGEAYIESLFDERIDLLTAKIERQCREEVLTEAQSRADSLLIERARRMRRIDGRPPRPTRPGMPVVKVLSAPLPLRPLFPFEIRFDTLLRDSLLQDSLLRDSLLQLRDVPERSIPLNLPQLGR